MHCDQDQPDPRFDGLPNKALAAELRRRRTASRNRDVRANPTNAHGRYKETGDMIGMARRALRALGRRVGDLDIDNLAALAELDDEIDRVLTTAVARLRKSAANPSGYSWAEIGTALGYDRNPRQAAYHRFARRLDAATTA